MEISLRINGEARSVHVDPRVSLLDLLRERLGLTGAKKGCDQGRCGACTVLPEGRRVVACLALAVSYDGASITTIEGLAAGDELHPLQRAFIAHDALRCGYCTPRQMVDARIALGGVARAPWRATRAEELLRGGPATEAAFAAAADAELSEARPLRDDAFKVTLARTLIVSTLAGLS
jgi:xanthine dehydrogenase YagT iron-sulfur-binding subunit